MGVLDTDFDNPDKLLSVVGSLWKNVYEGNDAVQSVLHARAQLDAQAHLDLLALVASLSRFTVPVFHARNWTLLRLLESQKDVTEVPRFGDGDAFSEGSPIVFGGRRAGELHAWKLPDGMVAAGVVLNRVTDASLVLSPGVDYTVADGVIRFRTDPFADDRVPKREVVEGGTVVDREAGLWAYHGEWDWDTVYQQFGYALGVRLKSSDGYRQLVNAVFDALVEGTTVRSVQDAFSAVCGIPLARDHEQVEEVWRDDRRLWVATDRNVYRFGRHATPRVAAGDNLTPGDPLVLGLRFVELNRGHSEIVRGLRAVATGKGLLAAGFYQELLWEDKDVPVTVTYPDGRPKVSWPLAGFPGDVELFFDRMHADGLAYGHTLADLLDTRPEDARTVPPPPAAIPATINPLRFLCDNVLRNNAFVVHLRPTEFGEHALGLGVAAQVLRRVIPPQTLCLVVAELFVADAPVTIAAPGNDERPGGTEAVGWFTGASEAEAIDPALVSENIRGRTLVGRCE